MAVSIGSNSASLKVQRSLAQASSRLSISLERLSSGQRINRASDDAAGLSVADRLRAETKLQNVAVRNLNDAISVVSIVDAALESQSSLILRLSELSEQSANGTYSLRQRVSLAAEYQALLGEYGRIGSTTNFNGLNLLSSRRFGNPSQLVLQAGINGGKNSLLSITTGDTTSFSGIVRLGSSAPDISVINSLSEISTMFSGQMGTTTITDNQGRQRRVVFGISRHEDDGTQVSLTFWDLDAFTADPNLRQLALQQASLTITNSSTGEIPNIDNLNLAFSDGATAKFSADFSALRVSQDLGEFTNCPNLGETEVIDFTTVIDQTSAKFALTQLQAKLSSLASLRGNFGAMRSRLQTASELAKASSVTAAAAESRIRDVDVAEESASVVASTILQQVGASVLANANQAPALALRLLNIQVN